VKIILQEQPAASASAAASPDDRATSFEAEQARAPGTRSGEQLLVEAYVFIWLIAFIFVGMMWRRSSTLAKRVDDLERAIDRADAKLAKKD
jgi:hypothetical protein